MSQSLSLMALEPFPAGEWLPGAQASLVKAGYSVIMKSTGMLAWRHRRREGDIVFSDGWTIRRMWLAPGRSAIGVVSRRVYFRRGADEIDPRQEHHIVSGNRPASVSAANQIASQLELLRTIQESLDGEVSRVRLENVDDELSSCRSTRVQGHELVIPPGKLSLLYREHGLDMVPDGLTISVCPLEATPDATVGTYIAELRRAAHTIRTDIHFRCSNVSEIEIRVRQLLSGNDDARSGRCVLFLLPEKSEEPSQGTMSLFARLQAAGVPFRRAYADDPLRYSVPNQLPSLILAAGGRPHRSRTEASGKPIWTVGVDLGHPLDSPSSVLALTLVDPDGALVGAWTIRQKRDETPGANCLAALLECCRHRLRKIDQNAHVVVLRDGRLFENENAQLYRQALGVPTSLYEFRKRGNPQVVESYDEQYGVMAPGACVVPDTNTMFVSTLGPAKATILPSFIKVTWRPDWNGLGLGTGMVARMLMASAAAPGLGLQPRNHPAAIYWADGIARTGRKDLRFAGVPRFDLDERARRRKRQ